MIRHVLSSLYMSLIATTGLAIVPGLASAAHQSFRVMSYNIHHGEGLDGKVHLERIADLIKSEQADIVALQEVDKGTERTSRRDFPAEFATLTGMTCVFSNNYGFQGGQYGNAVLTRFPVKQATNTHYKMLRRGEQRGLLQLTLDVHGREIVFMNTHIDHRPEDSERLSNATEVAGILKQLGNKPVILCGDFNDVPSSRTYRAFADLFHDSWSVAGEGDGFTIPARQAKKRIDYIWVSKDAPLRPIKVRVPQTEASDHLPVVAEFQFK